MLPVLDELAGARTRLRRALAARSHRYSGGRGHNAGTHLKCAKVTKKPTGCAGLWVICLGRKLLGRKACWVNQNTLNSRNLTR